MAMALGDCKPEGSQRQSAGLITGSEYEALYRDEVANITKAQYLHEHDMTYIRQHNWG